MSQTASIITTQKFIAPPFKYDDVVARGDDAKLLGASYMIVNSGSSYDLEITWSRGIGNGMTPQSPDALNGAAANANAAIRGANIMAVASVGARAPVQPVPDETIEPGQALGFSQRIVEYWEGCSLTPYHGNADRPSVWTIGWGCIAIGGVPVTAATPALTQARCDTLLLQDLQNTKNGILSLVKVLLTEYQLAALTSFTYNIGVTAFAGSTLLTLLNGGHVTDAAAQISRWVMSNNARIDGLIRRRGAETAVFLGKVPYGPNLSAVLNQYGDAALLAERNKAKA